MIFEAQFFNGKSSKPISVQLEVGYTGIQIKGTHDDGVPFSLVWDFDKVQRLEDQNNKILIYYGDQFPYENLTIKDSSIIKELERFGGSHPFMNTAHGWFKKHGVKAYGAALVGVLFVVSSFHFFIFPGLQSLVVESITIDYERSLSAEYLTLIKNTEDVDSAASVVLSEYIAGLDIDTEYEIEAMVINSSMVNAMALPGGYMVVYTGIIEKMDRQEQLAALIGHEVGHIVKKHSLNQMVNSLSKQYLLKVLVGGANSAIEQLGGVLAWVDQMSYSRDAEREADDFAFEVLKNSNLDPNGAVELFQISDDNEFKEEGERLLSTHPLTDERISNAKKDIQDDPYEFESNIQLEELFEQLLESSTE